MDITELGKITKILDLDTTLHSLGMLPNPTGEDDLSDDDFEFNFEDINPLALTTNSPEQIQAVKEGDYKLLLQTRTRKDFMDQT